MEAVESVGILSGFTSWIVGRTWQLLTLQNMISLVTAGFAVWKWWEAREANLYLRFERMISRYEHQLVGARSDLLDVMIRPGPGILIRTPLFLTWKLRAVLHRRRWHPSSLWPIGQMVDRRLASALRTCDRKVSAHNGRLSYFREQVATVRLVQGALAAGRAASAREEHERQRLDQEALDRFRNVLAIQGHQEDLAARELIAHQLARLDQTQLADSTYTLLIQTLESQPEEPSRNLARARAKRGLAVLRYPTSPQHARTQLAESMALQMHFGPPRDRDFLELAETYYLDAIVRQRLGANVQGTQQLSLAQGHYRDLIRSLHARRGGLFSWMVRERRYSGHRVKELLARAECGLAQVNHLIKLNDKHQRLLIASLRIGNGVRRHNRKPPC
jgi:hypothetical protein